MSRTEFLHGYTVAQLSLMMLARQDAQEQATAESGKKEKQVTKPKEYGAHALPAYVQDALHRYDTNPDSLPNVSFLSGGLHRSEI